MPLILTKETDSQWINSNLDKLDIEALLKPLPDNLMEAHTISKLITSRTESSNVPDVLKPFAYPELEEPLSLF